MRKNRVKRHAVTQPLDKPYRLIPLTQGQNAIVDVADFDRVTKRNWCAQWNKCTRSFYAYTWDRVGMHRLVVGAVRGEQVDHVNHDTLDNRRDNLRKATREQNQHNRLPNKGCVSRFKGVSLDGNKWVARISVNGRTKYLGGFSDEISAAKVYDAAAKIAHGEFANTNFPKK